MRLAFLRISRHLLRLHQLGWTPLQDVGDFVHWSPRDYNCVADCLANFAMDSKSDFEILDRKALQTNGNLRLCVDGGRRNGTSGGLGVAIYSYNAAAHIGSRYSLVGQRSIFLTSVSSAFVAETLAMESGLEFLLAIIEGMIT